MCTKYLPSFDHKRGRRINLYLCKSNICYTIIQVVSKLKDGNSISNTNIIFLIPLLFLTRENTHTIALSFLQYDLQFEKHCTCQPALPYLLSSPALPYVGIAPPVTICQTDLQFESPTTALPTTLYFPPFVVLPYIATLPTA